MIVRAPEEPLLFPEVSLTRFLLEGAERWGEKPAFIDASSGRTLTFRGWANAVRRTAAGLAIRGMRKGDVFAIYSPNVPEYAIAFHAVSLIGGISTTINPTYTVEELTNQLRDAGARYLVAHPAFLGKALEAASTAGIEELFVFGEAEGATPFDSLAMEGEPPEVAIDARHDLVALPYSSGTTGLPKGVMLTHFNLVANILQCESVMGLKPSDVILGVLPFFHIYGMVVIMNLSLRIGSTVVLMPRFELEPCLAAMQEHRVTYAFVVPPIVIALAKHPLVSQYDLSSIHTVLSGAAPLGASVAEAAAARLGVRVLQGFGMTETSPVATVDRANGAPRKAGGIGLTLPNTEMKIADLATGAPLGAREEGELCIRGPQVMRGYLNRPEATAAMIDEEGWLHSGDIGYVDEDGCFFIVDRVKELIKYKGLQIAPAELEGVLLSHPSIADAAVIPLADEEAGQVPKAYVVLKNGVSTDECGPILDYVSARVAPYKKLRALEAIDQIPKSPSGKILRRLLVARNV